MTQNQLSSSDHEQFSIEVINHWELQSVPRLQGFTCLGPKLVFTFDLMPRIIAICLSGTQYKMIHQRFFIQKQTWLVHVLHKRDLFPMVCPNLKEERLIFHGMSITYRRPFQILGLKQGRSNTGFIRQMDSALKFHFLLTSETIY